MRPPKIIKSWNPVWLFSLSCIAALFWGTIVATPALSRDVRIPPTSIPPVSIPSTIPRNNAPRSVWDITPVPPPIQLDIPIPAPVPRTEIRGVWLTNNDLPMMENRTKLRTAMTQLRALNFNTVYPVIWNSGYVNYPSAVAQRYGIQPFVRKGSDGHDILGDLVNQAKSNNLLVIPWFEFGFMVPQTSELATLHPDWLTETRDGGQLSNGPAGEVAWLNPFHPEVQQFITELVVEAVTQYNVDGIQFDDNMGLPREFGYDKFTRALYQKETKKSVPSNVADATWVKWRADKITTFMTQLKQTIKSRKSRVIFSISPNYYDHAYKLTLQDWLTWVQSGIVDELIMQVYRSDLNSFTAKLNRPEIIETQQKIPTAIGILTGLRRRPVPMSQIQSQTRTAQQRGLGVSYFYYESLWDDAPEGVMERIAGFQSLFPTPMIRS